ncbi:MAG: fumarate hydratase C-terminal domain-containing protein [Kiritimatiellae bacterium]|nr:fumarate hydratase C-terminal domain-containing protein [Kiritimatiellia bacterium]
MTATKAIHLAYPFTEEAVRALHAGEQVLVSGKVFTGRDRFHKHFADGGALPFDFRDAALFHCGPVVVQEGAKWRVVAAGPTTSVRENPYEPAFIAASGVRLIIGKGGMDKATLDACARHGAVYLQAVGGAAALTAQTVRRVVDVKFLEEWGAAEACWQFEMHEFPCVVAMDAHGGDLFAAVRERSAKTLANLLSFN